MSKRLSSLSGLFARNKTDVTNNRKSPRARSLNLEALESRELLDAAPIASLAANPIRETPAILCDAMLDDAPAIELFDLPCEYEAAVKLDAPVVTSTSSDSSSITVSWDAVPNATRYSVGYKLSSESSWTSVNAQQALSLTINSLEPYSRYDVRVLARGDDVNYTNSDWSTIATVRTEPLNPTAWVVTSSADTASKGSLRYAINHAQDGDTITFDAALKGKTIKINPDRGELVLKKSITIDATSLRDADSSQPGITVDGQSASGILRLEPYESDDEYDGSIDLTINWVSFKNGCAEDGAAINYTNDCSGELTLNNCAFSNNAATRGGAIYYFYGAAIVNNCAFTNNTADEGGAVWSDYPLTITNSSFSGNSASNGDGGAIRATWGSPTLTNCAFSNNTASGSGGAIYVHCSMTLNDCEFTGNSASNTGGAISGQGSLTINGGAFTNNSASDGGAIEFYDPVAINNVVISGNTASERGGAIFADWNYTITNSVLSHNSACEGGAIFASREEPVTLTNCLIANNTAEYNGGAICISDEGTTITASNCTITGNGAAKGGGVFVNEYAVFTADNTILYGNEATDSGVDVFVVKDDEEEPCGYAYAHNTLSSFTSWNGGTKNLTYDATKPLFVDAANENYALAKKSQGINKGKNDYATTTVDLAGNARVSANTVDLGAYEYQAAQRPLDVPTNLRETAKTETSISVAWDPVFEAEEYGLIYKKSTDSEYVVITLDADVTSYQFENLDNSAKYYWRVRAIGDGIDTLTSAYAATRSVTPRQKLDAPTVNCVAEPKSIVVNWNANPNASAYRIMYKPEGGSYATVNVDDATASTFTIVELLANTTYNVKVAAIGDGFNFSDSDDSPIFSVTTPEPEPLPAPIITSWSADCSSITASWNEVPNAERYSLYYRAVGASSWIGVNAKTNLTQTIDNLAPDTLYNVRLLARGDGVNYKNSPYSDTVTIKTESPAVVLQEPTFSTTPDVESITVTWTEDPNATKYAVYWKLPSATSWSAKTIQLPNTSYTIPNLTPNTTYEVRMRAFGDGVNYLNSVLRASGDPTTTLSEIEPVQLDAPVPSVEAKTATSITCAWNAVPNANGYQLIWKNKTDSEYTPVKIKDPTVTSCRIAGLDGAATYYWKVRALGDNVAYLNSPYCATQIDKPQQLLETPTISVVPTANSVELAWNVVTNASAYRIMYKSAADSSYVPVDVDPTETSLSITGLAPDTKYYVKMAAIGDGVDYKSSAYTALVSVRTEGGKLATPTIAAVSATAGTAVVNWSAVANAASYTITCGDEVFEDVPANATSFTIPDLTPSSSYAVTIQAIAQNAEDSSDVSAPKTIVTTALTVLSTPSLTVSATTGKTATLTWTAPTNGDPIMYALSYRPTSSASYRTVAVDASETSFTIAGLAQNTSYAFRIRAIGDGFETESSAHSRVVKATTTSASQAILDLGDELFDELEEDYDLLAENFVA